MCVLTDFAIAPRPFKASLAAAAATHFAKLVYITPFDGDLVQLQQQLQQFVGTSLSAEATLWLQVCGEALPSRGAEVA